MIPMRNRIALALVALLGDSDSQLWIALLAALVTRGGDEPELRVALIRWAQAFARLP